MVSYSLMLVNKGVQPRILMVIVIHALIKMIVNIIFCDFQLRIVMHLMARNGRGKCQFDHRR